MVPSALRPATSAAAAELVSETARVSAEFYINAINVMKGAEAISSYTSLPRQEAFNIEYWLLEEAKLSRMPKPKPLTGRIALITGSGGGIGKAIARKLIEEGCCVIISDNDIERLRGAEAEFPRDLEDGDTHCGRNIPVLLPRRTVAGSRPARSLPTRRSPRGRFPPKIASPSCVTMAA